MSGKVGNTRDFEVTINNKLVYSKQQTGSFPDFQMVVDEVVRVSGGNEPQAIARPQKGCIIV